MEQFGVYIIQSVKNGCYYIGSTNNIKRRLTQHNGGLVQATKNIRPLEIKCFISCKSLTGARQSEYRLKQYKRKDILEKVILDKIFPWDYGRD